MAAEVGAPFVAQVGCLCDTPPHRSAAYLLLGIAETVSMP
jgi:hypothetical protein